MVVAALFPVTLEGFSRTPPPPGISSARVCVCEYEG